jgi:SdrD B-like domain
MNKRYALGLLLSVAALLSLAMAHGTHTAYLPLVSRMPPSGPSLSGRVFFDHNGSSQQAAGEPGIAGVAVSVDSKDVALHATTGSDGSYSIPNVLPGQHQIYVQSPTQDPATAFRYINLFKGWVDIPAYEMNGVQVPAQHLPDTEIQPIDRPLSVAVNGSTHLDVALMQGFLTLPFVQEQVGTAPLIATYFDIIGRRFFPDDGSFTYEDSKDGVMLSYDGRYNTDGNPYVVPLIPGVGDSHNGYDYALPTGNYIVSGLPTGAVWCIDGPPRRLDMPICIWCYCAAEGLYYSTQDAHLDVHLVGLDQTVYRGQIIGLSGNTGYAPPDPVPAPGLHYDFARKRLGTGWWYLDPYRYTVRLDPLPNNFWGSEASWWTKDNDPQFPLVNLGD